MLAKKTHVVSARHVCSCVCVSFSPVLFLVWTPYFDLSLPRPRTKEEIGDTRLIANANHCRCLHTQVSYTHERSTYIQIQSLECPNTCGASKPDPAVRLLQYTAYECIAAHAVHVRAYQLPILLTLRLPSPPCLSPHRVDGLCIFR